MKTKFDIKSIVCGTLLGAAIVFTVGAAGQSQRTTWEYRVLHEQPVATMEKALNSAAADGWEFVGVTTDPSSGTFSVLRRPKQ